LPAVLKFIAEGLPDDIQLIVGLETPADYHFDLEIKLENDRYKLLQEDQYELVLEKLEPMIASMYTALLHSGATPAAESVS
jgi:hypothetical protein